MPNTTRLIAASAVLIAGCSSSSTPTADPTTSWEQPSRPGNVTFYVAGMNERLQIL